MKASAGSLVPAAKRLPAWQSFLLRVLVSAAATAAIVGISSVAMLFSTAPPWLSMVFEPLSLLLLPGMAVSLTIAGAHDLDPCVILHFSVFFYFVVILGYLQGQAWYTERRRPVK